MGCYCQYCGIWYAEDLEDFYCDQCKDFHNRIASSPLIKRIIERIETLEEQNEN